MEDANIGERRYWPVNCPLINEVQISMDTTTIPIPIWGWIPPDCMESAGIIPNSNILTKLAFEVDNASASDTTHRPSIAVQRSQLIGRTVHNQIIKRELGFINRSVGSLVLTDSVTLRLDNPKIDTEKPNAAGASDTVHNFIFTYLSEKIPDTATAFRLGDYLQGSTESTLLFAVTLDIRNDYTLHNFEHYINVYSICHRFIISVFSILQSISASNIPYLRGSIDKEVTVLKQALNKLSAHTSFKRESAALHDFSATRHVKYRHQTILEPYMRAFSVIEANYSDNDESYVNPILATLLEVQGVDAASPSVRTSFAQPIRPATEHYEGGRDIDDIPEFPVYLPAAALNTDIPDNSVNGTPHE